MDGFFASAFNRESLPDTAAQNFNERLSVAIALRHPVLIASSDQVETLRGTMRDGVPLKPS